MTEIRSKYEEHYREAIETCMRLLVGFAVKPVNEAIDEKLIGIDIVTGHLSELRRSLLFFKNIQEKKA